MLERPIQGPVMRTGLSAQSSVFWNLHGFLLQGPWLGFQSQWLARGRRGLASSQVGRPVLPSLLPGWDFGPHPT